MNNIPNFRHVIIDGVRFYEVISIQDEHDGGNGMLTVTLKFNAKKLEIDNDNIQITTFKPPDKL